MRNQRTVKNRELQNGSKSTNHSARIDGSENATVGGDLNFRFRMLLKCTVIAIQVFAAITSTSRLFPSPGAFDLFPIVRTGTLIGQRNDSINVQVNHLLIDP